MSVRVRASLPLPSSKGWMVTNQKCASPALKMPSRHPTLDFHLKEGFDFLVYGRSGRPLIVKLFFADRPGDNPHWPLAPMTGPNAVHARISCGEERRMPALEAFSGEWRSWCSVASKSTWARPSDAFSAGRSPALGSPKRNATEERTLSRSSTPLRWQMSAPPPRQAPPPGRP